LAISSLGGGRQPPAPDPSALRAVIDEVRICQPKVNGMTISARRLYVRLTMVRRGHGTVEDRPRPRFFSLQSFAARCGRSLTLNEAFHGSIKFESNRQEAWQIKHLKVYRLHRTAVHD
jgi:hypothetical protein